MSADVIAFWVLSVVAIGAAIAMVTMRNVVHGALMLVLNFFMIAGMFVLLQSTFLAVIQVIVYSGAIMVLFLFVIMLLGVSRDDLLVERDRWHRVAAWMLALLLIGAVSYAFVGPFTDPGSVCGQAPVASEAIGQDVATCRGFSDAIVEQGSVRFAAERLYTRYAFAFEFVGLLLVVGIVGAMIVGRREELPELPGGIPAEGFLPTSPSADDRVEVG